MLKASGRIMKVQGILRKILLRPFHSAAAIQAAAFLLTLSFLKSYAGSNDIQSAFLRTSLISNAVAGGLGGAMVGYRRVRRIRGIFVSVVPFSATLVLGVFASLLSGDMEIGTELGALVAIVQIPSALLGAGIAAFARRRGKVRKINLEET